jgi:hypothetical protein
MEVLMRGLTIIALVGCLSTPPRPNKEPNTGGCMDHARAVCDIHARCSGGYDIPHTYGDEDTCLARQAEPCIDSSQILNTGQTPERTAQCATQYATMSCQVFLDADLAGACANAAGPGEIGSPCAVPAECKSAFCKTTSTSVCGTCQPLPKIGDPCDAAFECGHALTCAFTAGICQPRVLVGAPCLNGYVPCSAGLSCMGDDPAMMQMGLCVEAAKENETCDLFRKTAPGCDGAFGLTCIPATHKCERNMLVGPGDMCGLMTSESLVCGAGARCTVNPPQIGICVAAVADGQPCDNDPTLGPPCLDPARCVTTGDGTAGICTMPDARMCN